MDKWIGITVEVSDDLDKIQYEQYTCETQRFAIQHMTILGTNYRGRSLNFYIPIDATEEQIESKKKATVIKIVDKMKREMKAEIKLMNSKLKKFEDKIKKMEETTCTQQ